VTCYEKINDLLKYSKCVRSS